MNRGVLIYLSIVAILATLAVVMSLSEPVLVGDPASHSSTFIGSLGEEFQYSPPIAVVYNPHGGADRAMFVWNGKPLGVMNIIGLPPGEDQIILREVITENIKKTTGAVEVTYVGLDNSNGCHFECFEATAPMHGIPHKYFCYMFFNWSQFSSPAQEILRTKFGGYRFEFVMPVDDYAAVKPRMQEIMDTFKRPQDRGP